MTLSNSIGIRAAQVIANMTHEEQDLITETIRDPSEAKRMLGELARLRAEDAFEIGYEQAVRAMVDKVAREVVETAGDAPLLPIQRMPDRRAKTFPKNTKLPGPRAAMKPL